MKSVFRQISQDLPRSKIGVNTYMNLGVNTNFHAFRTQILLF
jgi:hypothetical protein